MSKQRCETCRFWVHKTVYGFINNERVEVDNSECHIARPPWYRASASDFCGEWAAKENDDD